MLPRSKQQPAPESERPKAVRRINISSLRGDARQAMWRKILAEHPALAKDLQDGACARIRAAFPDAGVIISLNEKNRILTGKHRKSKP